MEVGDKVFCIQDNWLKNDFVSVTPSKDQILTIRERRGHTGRLFLCFEEIVNPKQLTKYGAIEPMFDSAGFRKIDFNFGESIAEEIEESINEEELELA